MTERASTGLASFASSFTSRFRSLGGGMGAVLIITTVIALQNFALVYVATDGGPGMSTIVQGS